MLMHRLRQEAQLDLTSPRWRAYVYRKGASARQAAWHCSQSRRLLDPPWEGQLATYSSRNKSSYGDACVNTSPR
jgi:hypothetical protein